MLAQPTQVSGIAARGSRFVLTPSDLRVWDDLDFDADSLDSDAAEGKRLWQEFAAASDAVSRETQDLVASTGSTAPLTQDGYESVAALKSNPEMSAFIRRVVSNMHRTVVDEGGLAGFVPFFSGVQGVQNFQSLEDEILSVPWADFTWVQKGKTSGLEHGSAPATTLQFLSSHDVQPTMSGSGHKAQTLSAATGKRSTPVAPKRSEHSEHSKPAQRLASVDDEPEASKVIADPSWHETKQTQHPAERSQDDSAHSSGEILNTSADVKALSPAHSTELEKTPDSGRPVRQAAQQRVSEHSKPNVKATRAESFGSAFQKLREQHWNATVEDHAEQMAPEQVHAATRHASATKDLAMLKAPMPAHQNGTGGIGMELDMRQTATLQQRLMRQARSLRDKLSETTKMMKDTVWSKEAAFKTQFWSFQNKTKAKREWAREARKKMNATLVRIRSLNKTCDNFLENVTNIVASAAMSPTLTPQHMQDGGQLLKVSLDDPVMREIETLTIAQRNTTQSILQRNITVMRLKLQEIHHIKQHAMTGLRERFDMLMEAASKDRKEAEFERWQMFQALHVVEDVERACLKARSIHKSAEMVHSILRQRDAGTSFDRVHKAVENFSVAADGEPEHLNMHKADGRQAGKNVSAMSVSGQPFMSKLATSEKSMSAGHTSALKEGAHDVAKHSTEPDLMKNISSISGMARALVDNSRASEKHSVPAQVEEAAAFDERGTAVDKIKSLEPPSA